MAKGTNEVVQYAAITIVASNDSCFLVQGQAVFFSSKKPSSEWNAENGKP